MGGYIGTKAVNLSTTGADINGNANVDGTLDVTGTVTASGITLDGDSFTNNSIVGTNPTLMFSDTGTNDDWRIRNSGGDFIFENGADGSPTTDRMRIDLAGDISFYDDAAAAKFFWDSSAGSLGIGTAAPVANLDVSRGGIGMVASFSGDGVAGARGLQFIASTTTNVGDTHSINVQSSTGILKFSNNNNTERMRINSSGNVLVGTIDSTPNGLGYNCRLVVQTATGVAGLHLAAHQTTITTVGTFSNPNGQVGSITLSGSATAYNTSSDYRLKENITPVQGASDIVKAMRPVTYNFKADSNDWHDGFLAHELQELHPRAVTGSKDAMQDEEYEVTPAVEATYDAEGVELTPAVPAVMGTRSVPDYQGVDYSKLTPILTAALQEALNKIDALEARLTALEATP